MPCRFLPFLLLSFVSCQQLTDRYRKTDTDNLELEANKVMGFDLTIRRSLADTWINTSSFCQSETDVNCALQLDKLQRQLNEMNPIPVPQPDAVNPISVSEATKLYRQFVVEHANEPILSIFQQLYPRILLNKYDVLQGTDYQSITYYIQQLTLAKALDFDTRTRALTRLQGHIPANEYAALVSSTIRDAKAEVLRQRKETARLNALIAADTLTYNIRDPKTYPTAHRKSILELYQQSTIQANMKQLEQLQSGL